MPLVILIHLGLDWSWHSIRIYSGAESAAFVAAAPGHDVRSTRLRTSFGEDGRPSGTVRQPTVPKHQDPHDIWAHHVVRPRAGDRLTRTLLPDGLAGGLSPAGWLGSTWPDFAPDRPARRFSEASPVRPASAGLLIRLGISLT
ncbi:hypothetical protein [Streptosporangium subroseum]|uniref:hypothetical protein n=1 Tax=Streptosporangium subroseum TaxID=106412 RepID=UPI00308D341F|nr:hypothetical protein OHB15_08590 [Streptosporangium subroseum]